jgi:hypothetical protein
VLAFSWHQPGLSFASFDTEMVVRLTRKLAEMIDDVDLSEYRVGQRIDLQYRAAMLLIAEGWAQLIERRRHPRQNQGPRLEGC